MKQVNLENLRNDMEGYDKLREKVISESRKIIMASKTAIYAIHRDELKTGEKTIEQMKKDLAKLKEEIKKSPRLTFEGIFKVAIQEYVEAASLLEFMQTGKIIPYTDEFVDPENYLMGLCDLSGELIRKAINSSIKENYKVPLKIRETLDELYTELSKFDFKNGELRRKYDGIKYDLKKMDDLVFELKMKDKI